MTDQTLTRRDIINRVIKIEGGFVHDANDSGGATKYGITHITAREFGYADVRRLTPEQAYDIYERGYWHPLSLDEVLALDAAIAEELFDTAVNMGKTQAVKFLQRALNLLNNQATLWPELQQDGLLGQGTLKALRALFQQRGQRAKGILLNMLNAQQAEFYMRLAEKRPKDETFQAGWQMNRVADTVVSQADLNAYSSPEPTTLSPASMTTPVPTPQEWDDPRLDPDYRAFIAARERERTTKTPLASKINWVQILGMGAAWGVPFLGNLTPEQTIMTGAVLSTLQSVVTMIIRTYFTQKTIRTGARLGVRRG